MNQLYSKAMNQLNSKVMNQLYSKRDEPVILSWCLEYNWFMTFRV
jgi:hypothetical protein